MLMFLVATVLPIQQFQATVRPTQQFQATVRPTQQFQATALHGQPLARILVTQQTLQHIHAMPLIKLIHVMLPTQ